MEKPVFPFTPVVKLLLDCLHQDPARQEAIRAGSLSAAEWNAFLRTAEWQNISALLFYRLKTRGILSSLPEPVRQSLFHSYLENSARNMRLFFCLKEILKGFQAENIPVIALKGAHLAHAVYKNMAVREMCDIDLLVPPDKLRAADKILLELSYVPQSPSDIDFEMEHFLHLPQYNKPYSPAIELHWTIQIPKPPCRFDIAEFWKGTERFKIEGIEVQGLARELLLVHICTHISHHHGFTVGLKGYCDIAEVLDRCGAGLNWQRVEDVAVRSGVKRGMFLSLFLAKELLGTKVPENTLKRLEPSNMDIQVPLTALDQFLSDHSLKHLHGTAAGILQRRGIWSKTKGMAQRVFLPRKLIARLYGQDPDSWYLFIFYSVRLKDLIARHRQTIWKYTRGDMETKSVVQRVSTLWDWLAGK